MTDIYYNKYIKYKSRYNNLKKLVGGVNNEYKMDDIFKITTNINKLFDNDNEGNIINYYPLFKRDDRKVFCPPCF